MATGVALCRHENDYDFFAYIFVGQTFYSLGFHKNVRAAVEAREDAEAEVMEKIKKNRLTREGL